MIGIHQFKFVLGVKHLLDSGIARAFPGGRVAHLEGQYEELLPTRDYEAGYTPVAGLG